MSQKQKSNKTLTWFAGFTLLSVLCGVLVAQLPQTGTEKRTGPPPIPNYLNYVVTTPAYMEELLRLGIPWPPLRASTGWERTLYAMLNPVKRLMWAMLDADWLPAVHASHGNLYTNRVNIDTPTDWVDAEPNFIAQTIGTTDYTVVGWIKERAWDGSNADWQLYRAVHKTGETDWTKAFMPLPTGYSESVDPVLAENLFADGQSPYRMYYAGLVYQGSTGITPQRIAVYNADSPYLTWNGPYTVEQNDDGAWFLDKPDMWVSEYTSTRGHVYVSYTKQSRTGGNDLIRFSKSTDGGVTWSTPVTVNQGPAQTASQILVNPNTGRIYVLWADFINDRIEMSQSDDQGANWSAAETAVSAPLLGGAGDDIITGPVRAVSVFQTRFNWVANAIGIAFHAWEDAVTRQKTDLYFVSKTVNGWQAKKNITPNSTNDQWMPGIDFDPNGQWMVSFFDRSADSNNVNYEEAWVRLQSDGTIVNSGKVLDVVATNPTNNHLSFVGDYQDVWWWDYFDVHDKRFNIAFPQLDVQGEMHASGVH